MRFSFILSTLLSISSVLGASLHQHIVKRSSSDICVSLDLPLSLNGHIFGHLDACVCISTLDIFIDSNPYTRSAVRHHGHRQVKEHLLSQIHSHHHKKKCHYPPHGKPSPAPKCSRHSDPCGFTCKDGFVVDHKHRKCVCPSPKIVYNGKCIPKPHKPGGPHPSGKPHHPPGYHY